MQLAAAMDDWAFLRQRLGSGGWQHLLAVSRSADPDPWRDRLRDTLEKKDPRMLDGLVGVALGDELPPATVVLLCRLALGTPAAERAVTALRQVQRQYPADFWVNEDLGQGLDFLRPPRPGDAIRYLATAVALRPQSAGARLCLGVALSELGQLDEAIAEYRVAIRLDKDFAIAHSNLGSALGRKGLLDDAIAESREAIRIKRDFATAHCVLGAALAGKGLLDEGIAEHRAAIRLNKDYANAHYNLGVVLSRKGRLEDGIPHYRAAIRIKKDFFEAHGNLGEALADKGLLDEAIEEYREAIRIKRDSAEVHGYLATAFMDKRMLDEAIEEYREIIRIKRDEASSPQSVVAADNVASTPQGAHCGLGVALAFKGLLDEAMVEFRAAIQIKKDYANAHYNLGQVLRQKGQCADALKPYEEALALRKAQLGPNHPDTLKSMWNVADTLVVLGRGVEAVPILDECVKSTAGKVVDPGLILGVMILRLRHFEKTKDAAGCRATAEMWEKLKRTDAYSLYAAACMRAVTAAVLRGSNKSKAAAEDVAAETDRAMAWMKQAVAAGYKDVAEMKRDKDIDALREREDFKKLLAELEAAKETPPKKP
jgi:tetratricopeptide (TPR) repeat protein